MIRFLPAVYAALLFSSPLKAQGLLDKIKDGAETAAETVGDGVEKAGDVVEKGADVVVDTVDSTAELISNEATPEETRVRLDTMAEEILARLLSENPDARSLYEVSQGYAAFDTRKVTVFPVTGGYGRGVAIPRTGGDRVYMNMGTGGVGAAFGIGGFETQFVILFETAEDLNKFIQEGYDAAAGSSVMIGEDTATQSVKFVDGHTIFVLDKTGWRVAASASGTKFWKSPELN